METWLGTEATFPAAEIEPGQYQAGSDRLIDHYARQHGVRRESLKVLPFYEQTVLSNVRRVVPKMDELSDIKHSAEE